MKKIGMLCTAILAALLLFAGCSGGTPAQSVEKTLEAVKTSDVKTFNQYVSGDSSLFADSDTWGTGEWDLMHIMYQNLSYKVLETNVDGGTATVSAEITNTDFSKIIMNAMDEIVSATMAGEMGEADETAIAQKMLDSMKRAADSGEVEPVTETVNITLVKEGSYWKVKIDDNLLNALGGGNLDNVTNMMR
ncbi:MAG: hypothetical protein HFE86_07365 [Clostridiales bacterium]|nr:hypothetical protein [Clostridiales bacterium]